ncbi:MAG: 16S rRNA (guanine(527)-N(7))-methyltransferase RsmG [Acidobacteria bacterium]|nr:16S rRNA (guanine(527)-N(7))-methyltransferase RsmG [Acidobacteriota bacterium]MBI3422640.1 16S rRNA (guanine(527)-N(7))-methyltransferase RsmG [Acidobacteriota bacterium]
MNTQKVECLKELLLTRTELAGQPLSAQAVEQIVQYYALVLKWNPQLHLTTITEPAEFFQRHIFEAFFLAQYLDRKVAEVWDIGSGLGIPGVPLAIVRPDLRVRLVEANRKKAVFLREVAERLGLSSLTVVNSRFETLAGLPQDAALAIRALEKLETLLPEILKLGRDGWQMLFLGGTGLLGLLEPPTRGFNLKAVRVPDTQAAFLITLTRST